MHEDATSISELRSGFAPLATDMRTKCGAGDFRILTTFTALMSPAGRNADGKLETKAFQ